LRATSAHYPPWIHASKATLAARMRRLLWRS